MMQELRMTHGLDFFSNRSSSASLAFNVFFNADLTFSIPFSCMAVSSLSILTRSISSAQLFQSPPSVKDVHWLIGRDLDDLGSPVNVSARVRRIRCTIGDG